MTDRELLIAAAKAAGIELVGPVEDYIVQFDERYTGGFIIVNDRGGHSAWNPLGDDGDALRLAVALDLVIWECSQFRRAMVEVRYGKARGEYWEPVGDDRFAATRQAITVAAAAIGGAG